MIENMVDLVGIEPTTSSMPWKRAPSCATGPLFGDTRGCPSWTAFLILAEVPQIVNAPATPSSVARRTLEGGCPT